MPRQPYREILAEPEDRHVETLERAGEVSVRELGMLLGQKRTHQLARDHGLGGGRCGDLLAVHADRLDEPLPGVDRSGLVEALTQVPDRRDPRGVVHALPGILATAVAAVLSDARSAAAIAEWAADAPQQVLAELGVFRDPFTGRHRAPD